MEIDSDSRILEAPLSSSLFSQGLWQFICSHPETKEVLYLKEDHYFKERKQIAHEILAYLTDHPDSRDTLEGIAQWWLLEQEIKCQIDKIRNALTDLVAKGLVLEYKSADSKIHYGINWSEYEGIQAFLAQGEDGGCQ